MNVTRKNVSGGFTVTGSLIGSDRGSHTEGSTHDNSIGSARSDVSAGFAHVSVLDISRADADATVIGDTVIGLDPVGPNFPIHFEINCEIDLTGDVVSTHRYCVRAVVRAADGTLQWTTDTVYPIVFAEQEPPGQGGEPSKRAEHHGDPIDVGPLRLISVDTRPRRGDSNAAVAPTDPPADTNSAAPTTHDVRASLLGAWAGVKIDDRKVVAGHPPVFEFLAEGRIVGTTGCNRFFGQWELAESELTIGPVGATLRACTPALNTQEQAVLTLLADVTGATVTVDGDELRIATPGAHVFIGRRTASEDTQ